MSIQIVSGGGGGGGTAPGDLDPDLDAIAALAPANNDLIQRKAGAWTNRTPAQVKTDLALAKGDVGLGNVDNTSDAAKPVSTATATALAAKQDGDADLTAIAGLAPANDDVIQRKAGAWTNRTPAQVKTDLALTKGDVGLANVDNTADTAKPISTATQTALDAKQPLDSDLTAIAALAPANDDFIQRKAGAWTNRTIAQVQADLGVTGGASAPVQLNGTSDAIIPVDNADSFIIGSDRFDHDAGASGAKNIRLWFNKVTGAFRAGTATGTAWDAATNGTGSTAIGRDGVASGAYSLALGWFAKTTRFGQIALATMGGWANAGEAQRSLFIARAQTTNATPTLATFDGDTNATVSGEYTSAYTILASRAAQFTVNVVARRTDVAGEAAGWSFEGLVARDATGSARIVGTTAARAWGDAGAALYDVALSINTTDATNNFLAITVTGQAAKTIRWVASIDVTEVG